MYSHQSSQVQLANVVYRLCGDAFRQMHDPEEVNEEGYVCVPEKCRYCKNPINTILAGRKDPSNPRRPDLSDPDCMLVGAYIVERVDKDNDHGYLMHMTQAFVNHYTFQMLLYFPDTGGFFRIAERKGIPLCNEM